MIKPGHIRLIDGKVKFVYHELEKPDKKDFWNGHWINKYFLKGCYSVAMRKYEASKRTIEVSNVKKVSYLYFFYFGYKVIMHPDYELKDGTPCKAEVNGTATIVELIN